MRTIAIDTAYDAKVTADTTAVALQIYAHVLRRLADEALTARIKLQGVTPIGGSLPDSVDLMRADRLGSELFSICLRYLDSDSRRPFQIMTLLGECDKEHRLSDHVFASRLVEAQLRGLMPKAEVAKW